MHSHDDVPALKLKSMNKCLSFVPRSTPRSLLPLSLPLFLHNRFRATPRRVVERNFQFRLDIGYAEREGEREGEGGRPRKKVVAWF